MSRMSATLDSLLRRATESTPEPTKRQTLKQCSYNTVLEVANNAISLLSPFCKDSRFKTATEMSIAAIDALFETFEQSRKARRVAYDVIEMRDADATELSIHLLQGLTTRVESDPGLARLVLTSIGPQVPSDMRVAGLETALLRLDDSDQRMLFTLMQRQPSVRWEFYKVALDLSTHCTEEQLGCYYHVRLGQVVHTCLELLGSRAREEFNKVQKRSQTYRESIRSRTDPVGKARAQGLDLFESGVSGQVSVECWEDREPSTDTPLTTGQVVWGICRFIILLFVGCVAALTLMFLCVLLYHFLSEIFSL
ncbi:hypothetical protein KIPB_007081 [Kipferlia bialata]|uniref:Uncharacterized protein n=1 Tax=Kipferlia bialata TaxID=797122 RepID=A0A391NTH0_9EUKA|nr:hypothetical protein KIPB_004319 [Kipferlia bialata]GCA62976.1 hypothetical protein KIPB_007081 [Kipferlia bialata]|eukprot:g4319.t1